MTRYDHLNSEFISLLLDQLNSLEIISPISKGKKNHAVIYHKPKTKIFSNVITGESFTPMPSRMFLSIYSGSLLGSAMSAATRGLLVLQNISSHPRFNN